VAQRNTWTHTEVLRAVSAKRTSEWAADDAWEEAWQQPPAAQKDQPGPADRRAWSVEELEGLLEADEGEEEEEEPQLTEDEAEARNPSRYRLLCRQGRDRGQVFVRAMWSERWSERWE
jgi:hypothetical protein